MNKKELKVAGICGINFLVRVIIKGQFYALAACILGLIPAIFNGTYKGVYIPMSRAINGVIFLFLFVAMFVFTARYAYALYKQSRATSIFGLKESATFFKCLTTLTFFLFAVSYEQSHSSAAAIKLYGDLLPYWVLGAIFLIIYRMVQPELYNWYLRKRVLNKDYLGYRKLDEPVPHHNIFSDIDTLNSYEDYTDLINTLNQKAVKEPYRDVVKVDSITHDIFAKADPSTQLFGVPDDMLHIELRGLITIKGHVLLTYHLVTININRKAVLTYAGSRSVKDDEPQTQDTSFLIENEN
ncbi:hypothetical protein [Streptococcus hyointestinalis]|uniref:hypothetical protein n=1 Tax=Streptococcus hyointestinalis TaxID=1337 RepID=UPI003F9A5BEA